MLKCPRTPALFLAFMLATSALSADSPKVPLKKLDKPAYIFLMNHGYVMDTPKKRLALTKTLVEKMDSSLQRAGFKKEQPIALWIEASMPARLGYSMLEPEKFYEKLQKETGLTMPQIMGTLVNPVWGKDAMSVKLREKLLSIYKGDQKKAPEAVKAGKEFLKKMPEDSMGEELGNWAEGDHYQFKAYRIEKPPFEAWVSLLRAKLWTSAAYESFQRRDLERAFKLSLYESIQDKRRMVLRDQKLAKDIAAWHKKHPEMLNVVLRGASHEFLAPELKTLGINSEVFREADMKEVLCISEMYGDYKPADNIYREEYVLTPFERRVMIRAFIERFAWQHLRVAKKIEYNLVLSKKLCKGIRSLSDDQLQEWVQIMRMQPQGLALDKEALITWDWLLKVWKTDLTLY